MPDRSHPAAKGAEHRACQREARELRKALRKVTHAVMWFLAALDHEMKQPSDHERGQRIGHLATQLDMASDRALHFALGMSFRQIHAAKTNVEACRKAVRHV